MYVCVCCSVQVAALRRADLSFERSYQQSERLIVFRLILISEHAGRPNL
jgi:hypothetical protein